MSIHTRRRQEQSISRRRWILSWLVPALGALLAIAALFWLYRGLDFGRFVSAFESANSYWLVVLAGTILLEQLIRSWIVKHPADELEAITTTIGELKWRLDEAARAKPVTYETGVQKGHKECWEAIHKLMEAKHRNLLAMIVRTKPRGLH